MYVDTSFQLNVIILHLLPSKITFAMLTLICQYICTYFICVLCSKAGISEMFEGHHGPITGIHCHTAAGPLDFSHLFVTSSFDWTVKLWSTKVRLRG